MCYQGTVFSLNQSFFLYNIIKKHKLSIKEHLMGISLSRNDDFNTDLQIFDRDHMISIFIIGLFLAIFPNLYKYLNLLKSRKVIYSRYF